MWQDTSDEDTVALVSVYGRDFDNKLHPGGKHSTWYGER